MLIIKTAYSRAISTGFHPPDPTDYLCFRKDGLRRFVRAKREDSQDLDALLAEYDRAKDDASREAASERIYDQVGDQLRGMVSRAAGGARLEPDDLDTFARLALDGGLKAAGVFAFRRSDGNWETLVQRMRSNDPVGQRLWGLLSPAVHEALSATYLKATSVSLMLREMNELLKRRDLHEVLGVRGSAIPPESAAALSSGAHVGLPDMTHANALMLAAAFPDARLRVEKPDRNLMGYIRTVAVPKLTLEMREALGAPMLDYDLQKVVNQISPIVGELQEMERTGTVPMEWAALPYAERVRLLYRKKLDERYAHAMGWWNEQIQRLLPDRPYQVKDAASWSAAKELFKERGVDPRLWQAEGAPHYVPKEAVHPYGVRSIAQAREFLERRRPTVPLVDRPTARPPSIRITPEMRELGSEREQVWTMTLSRLYPRGSAERAVGEFMLKRPSATGPEVERYVGSLPPDVAEDIRQVGWHQIERGVSLRIIDELRKPEVQRSILQELGISPSGVTAAVSAAIRLASSLLSPPVTRIA